MTSFFPYFTYVADLLIFGIIFAIMYKIVSSVFIPMFGTPDPLISFAISLFSAFPLAVIIIRTLNLFIDVQVPGDF